MLERKSKLGRQRGEKLLIGRMKAVNYWVGRMMQNLIAVDCARSKLLGGTRETSCHDNAGRHERGLAHRCDDNSSSRLRERGRSVIKFEGI